MPEAALVHVQLLRRDANRNGLSIDRRMPHGSRQAARLDHPRRLKTLPGWENYPAPATLGEIMTRDDLFAVARRHAEYADEPGISEQKRRDHLIAASVLMDLHVMLAAEGQTSARRS